MRAVLRGTWPGGELRPDRRFVNGALLHRLVHVVPAAAVRCGIQP